MMRSLVFSLCMGLVFGAPQLQYESEGPDSCCAPAQWEADFDQTTVLEPQASTPNAKTQVLKQVGHIWFDAPNNRKAYRIYQKVAGENMVHINVVADYNKKLKYFINPEKETCYTEPTPTKELPRCLNVSDPNVKYLKSLTIGLDLKVNLWEQKINTKQLQATYDYLFTPDKCILVEFSSYGAILIQGQATNRIESSVTSGVSLKLRDTDIFDIPSYCNTNWFQKEDMPFVSEPSF
ncbi:unnamed protein product [Owenia fusiformis]|uniref:Uncharacterized protein n=1 Tax=Owenia fusiformis TaxID=6347 RepID=A0A8J1Y5S5_OWEFU|nr:unnamed protein product [Owenia fusiformis]